MKSSGGCHDHSSKVQEVYRHFSQKEMSIREVIENMISDRIE